MKVLCALLFVCTVLEAAVGVSIEMYNNDVFVNGQLVDLSKLQVIKDSPYYTTYGLQFGESVITITKSKVGNVMSVQSTGPMTKEDVEKMKGLQNKISEEVVMNMKQVQRNIDLFNQQMNDRINHVNEQIRNILDMNMLQFPFF